jgi:FtsH-binding integral membrane protein
MSQGYEYYHPSVAAESPAAARATFIRRTYAHLAAAIVAFAFLETLLVNWFENWIQQPGNGQRAAQLLGSPVSWLLIFGGFLVVSWVAQTWAQSSASRGLQYLGLSLYVVCEAIIFLPILFIADSAPAFAGQHLIANAGIMTLTIFAGLTLGVFITGRDFSFLGPILSMISFGAIGLIVAAMLFGFTLGLIFSFAIVALMCGYILYYTSAVLYHYRTDQYVAASLALFASIATLFWYILRILMEMNRK